MADYETPPPPGEPPQPTPKERFRAAMEDARRAAMAASGKLKLKETGQTLGRGFSTAATAAQVVAAHPPVRKAAMWGGWAALGFSLSASLFFVYVTWGIPSTKDLWSATDAPSLTFKDRNGRIVLREDAQNAPPVDLTKLPAYVPQAVMAIEDRRFEQHWGVDMEGLARAARENLAAGRVVQGGSTITQQLAKNLFLTHERSFRRKAQEIALAFWLEGQFSKDEIMALYLSRVYFGAGAWGIEAAAERYFDKPAKDLTLTEAALLAGLLKAPSKLNPATEKAGAKARAEVVLDEMVAQGFISEQGRKEALAAPLIISRKNPSMNLGYFRTWIDPVLNELIGHDRDDYLIETTLDIDAQRAGERALETELGGKDGRAQNVTQGALVGMDAQGGVIAMVGGRGFSDSQFNRVTQARRQPGSSFKYFIFLAAIEKGISPYAVRVDQPVTIGDWSPGNYEDKYFGAVPLTTAYAKSLNMVAIQLANEVGHRSVLEEAKKLGVRTKLQDYRSLALGAQEMTLMELTQAYGAMASGGYKLEPHGITRVTRLSDKKVIFAFDPKREQVIAQQPLERMNLLMKRVVDAGTGTKARIEGRDIAGKTGTGNDYRDAWFIGYTPGMVAGVWVGNDNFAETKRVTGGSFPARIWQVFMKTATRDLPAEKLPLPDPNSLPAEAGPPASATPVPGPAGLPPQGELEEVVALPPAEDPGTEG